MADRPTIFHADAGAALASLVPARSVDMVYADPPFFTQREWAGSAGRFSDLWRWDATASSRMASLPARDADCLRAVTLGNGNILSYLLAMREIIRASWRTLRATGTLWLHCDDTASAHLRMVCDLVFRPDRFWGVVIWHRSDGANKSTRNFGRVQDTILVYMRSGAALERLSRPAAGMLRGADGTRQVDGCAGPRLNVLVEDRLNAATTERVGYPTQKPVSLLRKFIQTATHEGDLVMDPCCGSGTTLVAAHELGRRSIGIDASADAVATVRRRTAHAHYQMDLFGEVQHA